MCARLWHGGAHILHVKEVFAIRGKTCQHLDGVAMGDLEHNLRRTEAKSASQFYMWHEDDGDYLSG